MKCHNMTNDAYHADHEILEQPLINKSVCNCINRHYDIGSCTIVLYLIITADIVRRLLLIPQPRTLECLKSLSFGLAWLGCLSTNIRTSSSFCLSFQYLCFGFRNNMCCPPPTPPTKWPIMREMLGIVESLTASNQAEQ
jgi:hypothetical protein